MWNQRFYKISEFARLANVSVRLLHHYDAIDLFKPERVDSVTGYRVYSTDQLMTLNRILAFRDLGLSLEQIRDVLYVHSPDALLTTLREKQAELRAQIARDQARLRQAESRIQALEQEQDQARACDVLFKQVPELHVMSLDVWIDPREELVTEVFLGASKALFLAGLRPYIKSIIGLYHTHRAICDLPVPPIHIEAAYVIDRKYHRTVTDEKGRALESRTLPALPCVASVIDGAPHHTRSVTHQAMIRWARQNDYVVTAPPREVYFPTSQPNELLTEIQFPVAPRIDFAATS